MAIGSIPITLPQDAITDISNIVYDIRLVDQINFGDKQREFVESTNKTGSANGNGFVNTYQTQLLHAANRPAPGASNPFGDHTYTNVQQWLKWDKVENYAITEEMLWEHDRDFTSMDEVSAYQAWNYKLLQESSDFDIFDTVKSQFNVWGNNTVISGLDFSVQTANERINNVMLIAEWVYNRAKIYTNRNTTLTEETGVVTAIPTSELVLYVDSTVLAYMQIALGNIFNPQYVEEKFGVAKIIEIPSNTGKIPEGTTTPAMWLCREGKIAHLIGFRSFSIVDPEGGYKNTFLHRKFGIGKFTYHAGESICFAAPTP